MCRHAARSLDARAPTATLDCAMAKRFSTDACYSVADRALQILGGRAPPSCYPVPRVSWSHALSTWSGGVALACHSEQLCLGYCPEAMDRKRVQCSQAPYRRYGYLRDYPLERILRDLRVHAILEGTNEVMRIIIDRELNKLQPPA